MKDIKIKNKGEMRMKRIKDSTMRIKRKILSLILTSFLVVGMMPTVALAANLSLIHI